jgi:hypothetical protein
VRFGRISGRTAAHHRRAAQPRMPCRNVTWNI